LKVERDFSIIGTSVQRVDGAEKVTGKARYAGDLVVPGMIEGKFCAAHTRMRASSRSIHGKQKRCPDDRCDHQERLD
jgi:CO/xanthine dehydrogenase Mo-binding subunit